MKRLSLSPLLLFFVCAALTKNSSAQTFANVANFSDSVGVFPSSIVQGRDGGLWGTTDGSGQGSCGTIYRVTLAGAAYNMFTFDCADGQMPTGIQQVVGGDFYGTSFSGGSSNGGTVFQIVPEESETVLYNFMPGSQRSNPVGSPVLGLDGNFYGATFGGASALSYGTLFTITSSGALTTLYQFDFTHGAQPYASLLLGADGDLYGTTSSGGAYGGGTVFKITPTGVLTLLHSFGGSSSDGVAPAAPLIQSETGNFYGTTSSGGANNDGTVFMITPAGVFTDLHDFDQTDGQSPSGLLQTTNGILYGSTARGGTNADGTIFEINSLGQFVTLHNFDGSDGANPSALVQDTNGALYGITRAGGDPNCNPPYGCGTIYSLNVGLSPFVAFVQGFGTVGEMTAILGQKFTGTTSVSFNGTPANFRIVSGVCILATIPVGAKTGYVTVTTPGGPLTSNLPFQVLP
ncbi:MAG: choice-of-anchor tandem repeat GloVer-containing protein [Terriglobales bacterium]